MVFIHSARGMAQRAGETDNANGRTCLNGTMVAPPKSRTLGWRATCSHKDAPIPALVLDCFSGTASTGVAALRLGRRYLGIELSPPYVALSRARLAREAPLRAEYATTMEPADQQLRMEVDG